MRPNRHQRRANARTGNSTGKSTGTSSPDPAEVLNNRGMMLTGVNRHEEALATFDAALALNPDFVEAHNNRAVVLVAIKQWDEALLSYGRALALRPGMIRVLNNRGNLLQELGRIDEALADYDKALALDRNFVGAINGRGSALQKLNRESLECAVDSKGSPAGECFCRLPSPNVYVHVGLYYRLKSPSSSRAKRRSPVIRTQIQWISAGPDGGVSARDAGFGHVHSTTLHAFEGRWWGAPYSRCYELPPKAEFVETDDESPGPA